MSEIRMGISACLLGNELRYDGGHRLDWYISDILHQHFEFLPVCLEIEFGLSVSREAVRLDGDPKSDHFSYPADAAHDARSPAHFHAVGPPAVRGEDEAPRRLATSVGDSLLASLGDLCFGEREGERSAEHHRSFPGTHKGDEMPELLQML